MFKKNHPSYLKVSDGKRIFFNTNYSPAKYDPDIPTLFFNYGLVCNNHHWSKQLKEFDKRGYNLIIHDYRGHYNSSPLDDISNDCTFENISSDLFQLTQFLKLKNIIMLGHSMGVNITLEFCKSYPEAVKKQILISGSVHPPKNIMMDSSIMNYIAPVFEWFSTQFPEVLSEVWVKAYMNPLIKRGIHIGGFNTQTVPEEFVELYLKKIGELNPQIFFKLFNEMHRHKIAHDLKNIKTHSLVIAGEEDKVIPLHIQSHIHDQLPNSELYVVKFGSHVCQTDFPETVNERINLFICDS